MNVGKEDDTGWLQGNPGGLAGPSTGQWSWRSLRKPEGESCGGAGAPGSSLWLLWPVIKAKELTSQQLQGVEQVGVGETASVAQPSGLDQFRNKTIWPRLADLQPKKVLQMHKPSWSLNPSKTFHPVNVKSHPHSLPCFFVFSPEILRWAAASPLWDGLRPLSKVMPSVTTHHTGYLYLARTGGQNQPGLLQRVTHFTGLQETSLREESKWVCPSF